MLKYLGIYLSFLISLVIVDMVWLLVIAKNLYRDSMGDLMADEPNLAAGLAFYVLYAIGVCIFVIMPALTKQSWFDAVLYGALFGFFCYMTYDLTNLAVVRNFPTLLAFIDIAWGSFVTAALSGFIYWLSNKIFPPVTN
jgi:uncharacterized membrane protein